MELHTDRMKLAEVFPDAAKSWAKRLHIKADTIDYVRKGIPIDPADISIEDGERAAVRYVSTPRLDRDGEIMLPDGAVLDTFRDAPTVLYAHDYSGLPIGKDIWIKPTKRGLLAKTVYANHQLAQDVYDCVKDGFLTSSSVGFIPVESVGFGDKDFPGLSRRVSEEYGVPADEAAAAKRIYTKWILLEHSDVPVPSNAQSLNVLVGKGISARLKKDMGVIEPEPDTVADIPGDKGAVDSVVSPEKAVDKAEDISGDANGPEAEDPLVELEAEAAAIAAPVETFTGPEFAADPPAIELINVMQGIFDVRADIASLKSSLQAHAEAEEVDGPTASMPFMLADLCKQVSEIKGMVEELKAGFPARAIPEEPASVAPVEPLPPMPRAKDDPAPTEPAPDVRAIVAEAMKSLDVKAISEQAAALALAKLRGRVEAK